jgi:hypothetical protein
MTESPASLLAKCAHTICLRGFSPNEQESAAAILGSHGHRVVRSLGVAQFVVTGPDVEPSVLSGIRSRGIQFASWEAVREELSLATESANAADPAVPIARQPVLPMFGSEDGKQRFLDLRLPSCAQTHPEDLKLVPPASRFAGLCFDQTFVETLHAVITGTTHAMPVALEGETAASKTTAILYLAHRLGQAVIRLNLNGQTDAGELVGRYVPAEGGWAFHEGVLPVAMRRGHWLLLDEMNLAEPQVLERLNSALESPPTLVVSEGPGTVFGRGGDVEPAPDFRLLATLNPAEYSGRSVLSPSFRNRWLIWHQAQIPTEADSLALLRTLVFGTQPVVHWRGRAYQADPIEPIFSTLAGADEIETLLAHLAHFHTTVGKAADPQGSSPGLGRHRRERDSFTRRNLMATLQLWQSQLASGFSSPRDALANAVERIYTGRYPDAADRKAIHSHARASGLA